MSGSDKPLLSQTGFALLTGLLVLCQSSCLGTPKSPSIYGVTIFPFLLIIGGIVVALSVRQANRWVGGILLIICVAQMVWLDRVKSAYDATWEHELSRET